MVNLLPVLKANEDQQKVLILKSKYCSSASTCSRGEVEKVRPNLDGLILSRGTNEH